MSLIKPQIETGISEALKAVGLGKDKKSPEDLKKVQQIFTDAGAGIEDIAERTADLMDRAETDAGKLGALRLAAEIHKLTGKELEGSNAPVVNIQINFTQNNVNMQDLLMPTGN